MSEVIPFSAQKSSISCVSRIPPMAEPARLRRFIIKLKLEIGDGFSGAPTSVMVPSSFNNRRYAFKSCSAETASRIKLKLFECFSISALFFEITTSSAPRRKASAVFAWGRGEKHDVSAEGMGKFHPHVPQP